MKTFITFGLENTDTTNILVGVTSIDDLELLNQIREEQLYPKQLSNNTVLHKYIFDHIEDIDLPYAFKQSYPHFDRSVYRVSLLGSYGEMSDAIRRMDLSLDSFANNQYRFEDKYCYNLHHELTLLPNEESIIADIKGISNTLQNEANIFEKEDEQLAEEATIVLDDTTSDTPQASTTNVPTPVQTEEKGKNPNKSLIKQQAITIINIATGEEHSFTTKGDCTKFLNCSSATFSKFLSGLSKLNKDWKIKDKD